ncbi:hypothetical protein T12_12448 [Trichinella patagoniensis]|uniref:Uncharacterized protein n=1 Tax=Trichinella patagoniensis TaxID=990121 RepID=A0A0V0ZBX2_9BILA|nr:hypothetical protein T12_12448 [Trichinella patagoniensis]
MNYSNSKGYELSVISGFEVLCSCSALHYSLRQDVHGSMQRTIDQLPLILIDVKQKNALRYFEHMIEKDTMHKNACINRSNVHLEIDTLHIANTINFNFLVYCEQKILSRSILIQNQEINAINHIIKICISDNVEKGEAELNRKCRRIDEATGFELGFVVAVLEHKWKNYRNLSSVD